MSRDELKSEIEAGVRFSGYEMDGKLVAGMGIQDIKGVTQFVMRILNHLRKRSLHINRKKCSFRLACQYPSIQHYITDTQSMLGICFMLLC